MTHVADELRIYADVVTEGSYLIAEDTHLNGHPVDDDGGPGPWEAVEVFLKERPEFVPDPGCERLLHTFSPRGFLRRCGSDAPTARLAITEAKLAERDAEIVTLQASISEQEAAAERLRQAERAMEAAEKAREEATKQLQRAEELVRAVEHRHPGVSPRRCAGSPAPSTAGPARRLTGKRT